MLALSAFLAIRDAVAGNDTASPALQAPATPEAILRALHGASGE
jgi:xanthine dehydrogenase large subunit